MHGDKRTGHTSNFSGQLSACPRCELYRELERNTLAHEVLDALHAARRGHPDAVPTREGLVARLERDAYAVGLRLNLLTRLGMVTEAAGGALALASLVPLPDSHATHAGR